MDVDLEGTVWSFGRTIRTFNLLDADPGANQESYITSNNNSNGSYRCSKDPYAGVFFCWLEDVSADYYRQDIYRIDSTKPGRDWHHAYKTQKLNIKVIPTGSLLFGIAEGLDGVQYWNIEEFKSSSHGGTSSTLGEYSNSHSLCEGGNIRDFALVHKNNNFDDEVISHLICGTQHTVIHEMGPGSPVLNEVDFAGDIETIYAFPGSSLVIVFYKAQSLCVYSNENTNRQCEQF